MKIKPTLTQAYLKSILMYDPDSGLFIWRERHNIRTCDNSRLVGKVAGYLNKGWKEYWKININGSMYQAHRLAWIYMHGDVLDNKIMIDHKDGNKSNNKINNLRIATASENSANAKRHKSKCLPKGVSKQSTSGNYLARITTNFRTLTLGTFKTIQEAHDAYRKAARDIKGEFARID